MNRQQNYFELFSLPVSYQVDQAALRERYKELQQQFHPDRYSDKSAQDKRLAMQFASEINSALQTLKSPLLRAQYLLELAGQAEDTETRKTNDPAFLMAQMELREQLQEIPQQRDPFAELDALQQQADATYSDLQQQFVAAFSDDDFATANDLVGRMQFYVKLLAEIDQLEQELEE